MAFNDIIRRKRATQYDLLIDFGTFKWSFRGVDVDSVGHYQGRIKNCGQIRRYADPSTHKFDISPVEFSISNTANPSEPSSSVGFYTSDIRAGLMTNVDVTIQVFVRDEKADETATKTIYKGTGNIADSGRDERIVNLIIRPAIYKKLGPIQHMITQTRFPLAAEKYLGTGIPLSYGSGYDSQDAARWVELPIVDTVLQDIAVTQILISPGASASADFFDLYYTEQAGGGAPVSLGTKTSVADVDDNGDGYRRFRLVGGDYNADRRYFTPRLPFRSDIDHPWYPLDDIESLIVSESLDLVSGDIDATSFSDVSGWINSLWGFDAYSGSGFSIPVSGAPGITADKTLQKGWGIIQDMLASLGVSAFINYSGQIAVMMLLPWPVTSVNTSSIVEKSASVATYRREDLDIKKLRVFDNAFEIINDLVATSDNKGLIAPGSRVNSERYQNIDSQTRDGILSEEAFRRGINFFGENAAAEQTSGRVVFGESFMKLHSGAYYQVNAKLKKLIGLMVEIGDNISLSDPRNLGSDEDMQVFGVTFDPMRQGETILNCVNIHAPFGTITIIEPGGQFGLELGADEDMYVDENDPATSFGAATILKHGHINGGLTGAERTALRFDLTTIDSAGGTIISAELDLNLQSWLFPSAIWLTELTAASWVEAENYNNFETTGWVESFIGSDIAPVNLGVSVGIKTFTLNAAGLTFLNAQLGSGNKANITFRGMNEDEHYIFSSSRDSNVASRPKLRLSYTT